MTAPGGDEERVAEIEKGEAVVQEPTLAQESAKKPPKMIEYKKRVIREFSWNEGIDSLHRGICNGLDCGAENLGPDGFLVNKHGDIYIFDYDAKCEGFGAKLYKPEGKLIKAVPGGGEPLGIDGNGNIFLTNTSYDSQLNLIKTFRNQEGLSVHAYNSFISEDGMLFILSSIRHSEDKTKRFYSCNPKSNDYVVDKYLANKYPNVLSKYHERSPCNIIEEKDAPYFLRFLNNYIKREFIGPQLAYNSNLYLFKVGDTNYKIQVENGRKAEGDRLICIDNGGYIYIYYRSYDYSLNRSNTVTYHIAVLNAIGETIPQVQLNENTITFTEPHDMIRYIYIEPYSGKIYQLCVREEKPSLIVWER